MTYLREIEDEVEELRRSNSERGRRLALLEGELTEAHHTRSAADDLAEAVMEAFLQHRPNGHLLLPVHRSTRLRQALDAYMASRPEAQPEEGGRP